MPITDISTPCPQYVKMSETWELISALCGGTAAMRASGVKYLPKEAKETYEKYNIRLNRSILVGWLRNTIGNHSSRPFSKPVTFEGNLPDVLKMLERDADMEGTDLTQFMRGVFESAEKYGLCHVLVDHPKNTTENLQQENQQRADGTLRPYFVCIEAPDLIGWQTTRVGGKVVLDRIRIKECVTKVDANGAERDVDRVRVFTRQVWEVWERADRNDASTATTNGWVKVEEGKNTFGEVPLYTVYFAKTGMMTAEPPLEDLAWLNLVHWQSMSDQRNILRFARLGLLFASGVRDDDIKNWHLGPNALWNHANDQAKLQWVEQDGTAIKLGQEDLDNIEEKIMVFGMQPLLERFRNRTATAVSSDESRANTEIEAWVEATERLVNDCMAAAMKWVSPTTKLPEGFKVKVFQDFAFNVRTVEEVRALIDTRKAREISRETFLNEMKRRMFLSEGVNVQEEIGRLDNEGMTEADFGNGPGDNPLSNGNVADKVDGVTAGA